MYKNRIDNYINSLANNVLKELIPKADKITKIVKVGAGSNTMIWCWYRMIKSVKNYDPCL